MPQPLGLWGIVAPFELGEVGKPVQILRTGIWHFDDIGPLQVTKPMLQEFADNFKKNVRRGKLPITREHQAVYGSLGNLSDVYVGEDGESLYAVPEYNDFGEKEVKGGAWNYTSAELYHQWTDPETQQTHNNVLSGLTYTNYPRIKDMAQITCAEPRLSHLSEDRQPELPAVLSELAWLDDWQTCTDAQIVALLLAEHEHYTPTSVRDKLPDSAFAFPAQKKLLIHRMGNVKAAIGRFKSVQGVTDSERDVAWGRLKRAATKFGIDLHVSSWRDLGKSDETKNMSEGFYVTSLYDQFTQGVTPMPETKTAEVQLAEMQTQMAEQQKQLAEQVTKMQAQLSEQTAAMALSETARKALETQLAETDRKLALERETREQLEFSEGVDKARRELKISPAQATTYLAEGAKMSADVRKFVMADITTRPVIMSLGEQGSGTQRPGNSSDGTRTDAVAGGRERVELAELTKKIKNDNKGMSHGDALKLANKQLQGA